MVTYEISVLTILGRVLAGFRLCNYNDLKQQANSLNNNTVPRAYLIDKYPELINKAFNNCITKEPKDAW